MAALWRLVNNAGTDVFDLQTAYLRPMLGSWQTTYPGDGTAIDTMLLIAKNTTDANAMTAALQLTEMCDRVRRYTGTPLASDPMWMELNANTETAKRALIVDMSLVSEPFGASIPILGKNYSAYRLTLTRTELFESSAVVRIVDAATNCLGGTATITSVPGSAPARIESLHIAGHNGGGGPIDRVWCGIRPFLEGVSGFNPLWELEDGTTTGTKENDADASPTGGGNNSIRYALNTIYEKTVSMTVDQATAGTYYEHFVGQYMVLLRYKLGGAGTAVIQGRYGFTGNATFAAMNNNPTSVTNTTFRYMQLGTVSIPPFGFRKTFHPDNTPNQVQNFEFQIWAYRIGGAVNLILDCLVLIPYPCYTYSEGSAILYSGATYSETRHYVAEDGRKAFICLDASFIPNSNIIGYMDVGDWQAPIEGGVVVFAGERTASQVISDHIDLAMDVHYRYQVFGEST